MIHFNDDNHFFCRAGVRGTAGIDTVCKNYNFCIINAARENLFVSSRDDFAYVAFDRLLITMTCLD